MKDLLNKFLYGPTDPRGTAGAGNGTQVFSVQPNPQDENTIFIIPAGQPKEAPPLYTISKRPSKPNFVVFRGPPTPQNTVATATMHMSSTTVDLSIYNQPMVVKNSSLSGNWSLETPQMGTFKWKVSQLTGTGFELSDGGGRKLAKYGSAGITRLMDKQLTVYVPCDEFFIVTMFLSAIACKELTKIIEEVVGEVVGGIAGA
ncbi:hypothetical protein FZEAL_6579 [Fusarium zealandicum]|uniref:Uncharacterized protein n=1 Tax=Fusarium zealandicum TaxID=1053134 RepID=A0A8H4UHH5_9HYPO|nr:hypothetical protein FZEAL_6579 [Fusarium zealandicum]